MNRKLRAIFGMVMMCVFVSLGWSQTTGQEPPRRFAILVGINQYGDQGILTLQKAQNDATDLAKLLSKAGGYTSIKLMTGDLDFGNPLFPSRDNIIGQFEQLSRLAKPTDQILFFFSGHGFNDNTTKESYLLAKDSKARDIKGSSINLQRDILDKFKARGLNNVVALVDACQKNLGKDKGVSVVGVSEFAGVGRAVVITATGPGLASYEDPSGPNGLFTRGLLSGLSGEADIDHDGVVSVIELGRYLPDAVELLAFNANFTQRPQVYDSGAGSLQPELVRLAVKPTPSAQAESTTGTASVAPAPSAKSQFVQFKLPESVRADIRILDSTGREVLQLSDTSGASPRLEPGTYRLEAQDRLYQYYPYSQGFSVAGAKQVLNLELKPNFGSLNVNCDPGEGVDVLVNGEKKGTVSGGHFTLEKLKSGSYTMVLHKDLYDTKSQTLLIEDGKAASLSCKLNPNFFSLDAAAPAGLAASLWVDGKNVGPLPQSLKLTYRDTVLKAVPDDPRYKEWNLTLRPQAKGSVEKPSITFDPRQGTLILTTTPDSDAELVLAPKNGGATQKIGKAPIEWEGLIGDYTVSASVTLGGKSYSGTTALTIREGQTTELSLEMKAANTANLVQIPGGTFTMGSPAGEKDRSSKEVQHQVSVSSFSMAKYTVTFDEYDAYCKSTGTEEANDSGWGRGSRPVINVSWYDAIAYCNWRSKQDGKTPVYTINGTNVSCNWSANGYRLPTEAEWEYACRAGTNTPFYTGGNITTAQANYNGNSPYNGNTKGENRKKTLPVGSFAPNAFGLYDMAGNVWQWCWDLYGAYSTASASDPAGASSGDKRVHRGGSWSYGAWYLRSALRDYDEPNSRGLWGVGFRLVCRP